MNRILFLLLCLIPALCFSQREAANWYFGSNAGLDFNSGEPVPLLDGVLNTIEGCESISSPDGSLLFYTEGRSVWNRFHELMPNGEDLLGSFSSTQSALIIPRPGVSNIYYVITADVARAYQAGGNGNGINYSVVDMNADGGRGDVIEKNTSLLPQGSEKLTGVRSADGDNFWVVTHFRDSFYAFFVDDTGLDPSPVVTTIGPDIDNFENIRGAIKSSPNGNKLAIGHAFFLPNYTGILGLYDFDNETGVVSNQNILANDLVFYGVEFSADSSKLYASGKEVDVVANQTTDINILQYDLEAPDIASTRFKIADIPNPFLSDLAGSLQIAIDKKIYHSIPNSNLSVIRTPNFAELDSDFRLYSVELGGRSTKFGLPPFIQSFFESIVDIEFFCFGDATQFTISSEDVVTGVSWDFGDPASGAANTSTLINPSHVFSTTGVFTVTFDVTFATRAPQRFIEFVEIGDIPDVNAGVQLTQCDIDGVDDGITPFNLEQAIPLLLDDPEGFTANFFRTLTDANNNENPLTEIGYINEFDGQIIYARIFENARCFAIEPVQLFVTPMAYAGDLVLPACNRSDNPDFEFVIDLSDLEAALLETYPGTEIYFYPTRDDALFELNELIDVAEFSVFSVIELYFRVESDNDCVTIGRILPDIRNSPQTEDQEIYVCPDDTEIVLSAGDFFSYSWSTGETTASITVSGPGEYSVSVFNGTGCDGVFNFSVIALPAPDEVLITVLDFQDNNQIVIEVTDPDAFGFSVDHGPIQADPILNGVLPGLRTVQIWSEGCLVYSEEVFVGGAPNYFTPNGDGYHDLWHLVNPRQFQDATTYIYDRYGKMIKVLRFFDAGWDGTYRGNPLPSSDYWYRIELTDGRVARGHFSLIRR
ncbi:MAG: T9SS type B sorting domain-containing protein [Gilvibacter sp.]